MSRPSKFDRDEAVQTAMREIWREGYEASSVKRLSEVLGITRSSFYNAFKSREDLFREAVGAYLALKPQAPALDSDDAVLPRLTEFVREVCTFNAQHGWQGCLIANTIAECCPAEAGPAAEMSKMTCDSVQRYQTLLDRAKANGEIPASADTKILALALQNMLMGLGVFAKALRCEEKLWELARLTLTGLGLFAESPKAPAQCEMSRSGKKLKSR
jgi:TetR/AcrR family transcriptional regulator, transcriptional repressor for nem operon